MVPVSAAVLTFVCCGYSSIAERTQVLVDREWTPLDASTQDSEVLLGRARLPCTTAMRWQDGYLDSGMHSAHRMACMHMPLVCGPGLCMDSHFLLGARVIDLVTATPCTGQYARGARAADAHP